MGLPAGAGPRIRFGEFELDPSTRELHGPSRKLNLQEQPFQILLALLERPGQMVTREELTRRLWPTGTFVDFERSLNKAVNRLREALEDSAEQPRFIETLPRLGYRFVGVVSGNQAGAEKSVAGHLYEWPSPGEAGLADRARPSLLRRGLTFLVISLGIVALVGLVFWWLPTPAPTPQPLKFTQITHDGTYKDSLHTDGARIYYRAAVGGKFALREVAAAGGEPATIAVPFDNLGLQDLSADGSELLLSRLDSGLEIQPAYRMSLPAGTPQRFGDIGYHAAAWSPDGQEVAYAADTSIFVARRDGSGIRKLADVPGETDFPRWSPDGKRLRFTVYGSQKSESFLWEVARDGSDLHQLTLTSLHPHRECCGQWTSDGRYFLFLAEQNSIETLWAVREGSSWWKDNPAVQLTLGPTQVTSFVPGRTPDRVFLINGLDRSELLQYDQRTKHFNRYLGGMDAFALEFSHDRKRLIYTNPADGTLLRSQADGKGAARLTDPGMYALKPRWSPDDTRIAFCGYRGEDVGQAFVLSAEGGSPRQLTTGPKSVGFLSWSRDGRTLLVGEWNAADTQEENFHTIHSYFLDVQSGEKRPLKGSEGLYGAQWSPDGRFIFAKTQTDDLRLLNLQSGVWSDLAVGPAVWATWSHDSRFVYFGSTEQGSPALKRVRISDGKAEVVTGLAELQPGKGRGDRSWLGLDPDDVPLAARDVSTYDVYALDLRLP